MQNIVLINFKISKVWDEKWLEITKPGISFLTYGHLSQMKLCKYKALYAIEAVLESFDTTAKTESKVRRTEY